MISYVYQIRNIINNKRYIGSALNDVHARYNHISFDWTKHHNRHLRNSANKYGNKSFVIEVIEMHYNVTQELILAIEQTYLNMWWETKLLYNSSPLATGGSGPHTKEVKHRLRKLRLGELNPMYGVTGSKHPMYGRKHTLDARTKISVARARQVITKEHKDKISHSLTNRVISDITRTKHSDRQKCNKAYWYNKSLSNEHKANISKGQRKIIKHNLVTPKIAKNIINDYNTGNYTYKQLAKKYNVYVSTIRKIRKGTLKSALGTSKINKIQVSTKNAIIENIKNYNANISIMKICTELAKKYNVGTSSVYRIIKNLKFKLK